MSIAIGRAPVTAGARPYSWQNLGQYGSLAPVFMRDLEEGDVILSENTTYCVIRKHVTIKAGSAMLLREMGTNSVRSTKFDPHRKYSLIMQYSSHETPKGEWTPRQGDVLYFWDHYQTPRAAIRHYRGWFRTAAPWVLLSDIEMLRALDSGNAVLARGGSNWSPLSPDTVFRYGTVVATTDLSVREPSVWVRLGEDNWTSNSRGAVISDTMVRYEMRRGTYQILKVIG